LENGKPTFIDLFAGVGGFRIGLERVGWKCVWSSDKLKSCQKIYRKHFGDIDGRPIRQVDAKEIPDHDMLVAGFPCQAFSLAGKRKGFEDARGTLFFDVARITKVKRPTLLLLENVRGLLSAQKGYCFFRIIQTLDELGYDVEWQVLNSKYFGVPQSRERVFIVGHLRGRSSGQIFPIGESSPAIRFPAIRRKQKEMLVAVKDKFQKQIYDSRGIAPTLREGHGDIIKVILGDIKKKRDKKEPNWAVLQLVGDRDNPSISVKNDEFFCLTSNPMSDRQQLLICRNDLSYPLKKRNKKEVHGDLIKIIQLIQNKDKSTVSQVDRVYSPQGISPTLSTPSGGRHIPQIMILGDNTKGNIKKRIRGTKENPSWTLGGSETLERNIKKRQSDEQERMVIYDIYNQRVRANQKVAGTLKGEGIANTSLSTALIYQKPENIRIRRLTPVECERLQGFPDGWTEGVSDTQRYKLMGNAVTVNVVEYLGKKLMECLDGQNL